MDEKKVYDIFPPDKSLQPGEVLGKEDKETLKELAEIKEPEEIRKQPHKSQKERMVETLFFGKKPEPFAKTSFKMGRPGWILVLTLLFLLAGAGVFYLYLPKVTIDLWLKTEEKTIGEKIDMLASLPAVDLSGHKIPGKIIEEEKFISQDFPASGLVDKEEKARGTIRIFNNYSTASQPLMVNTRFISKEGKLFRLVAKAVVPGKNTEGGKTTPGFADAKVAADAAGADSNIGPSTFSVPGFVGTPKYTAFYARSFSPMEGGFKGQTAVVTEQDLENAKNALKTKIDSEITRALEEKTLPDFVLIKEGSSLEIVEENSLAKAGEAVGNFTYQVKAKKRGLLLLKKDLDKFGEAYFLAKVPEDKKVLSGSLQITSVIEALDLAAGKANLNLKISAKTYQPVDAVNLKTQLANKTLREVARNLQEMAQISRAKIKVFPSFFNSLPENTKKIELNVKFD